ncbi:uncharacterized protein LOC118192195 isoform X1 [Stegodyphus dumicola]|uniref:uncharacterized protein LOC118192195 isoform X1 n=1 Tax=Stegodyphus dumicola TaxID=202533 RepID=UPI0015AB2A5C|nr:uncharacterized protein LOC118192195 isoform X1 [Stegodyphus dumicola]
MDMYKKKPLRFSGLSKQLRSVEINANRNLSRHTRLSLLRGMDADNSEVENSKENTGSETFDYERNKKVSEVSVKPKTKAVSRLEMLKKWKEEKLLKKQLEAKLKKPAFKIGKTAVPLNPIFHPSSSTPKFKASSSLKSNMSINLNNGISQIKSKIPSAPGFKQSASKTGIPKPGKQISHVTPKCKPSLQSSKPVQQPKGKVVSQVPVPGLTRGLRKPQSGLTQKQNLKTPKRKTVKENDVEKEVVNAATENFKTKAESSKSEKAVGRTSFAPEDFVFQPLWGLNSFRLSECPTEILKRLNNKPIGSPVNDVEIVNGNKESLEDNKDSSSSISAKNGHRNKSPVLNENVTDLTAKKRDPLDSSPHCLPQPEMKACFQNTRKSNKYLTRQSVKSSLETINEQNESAVQKGQSSTTKTSRVEYSEKTHVTPRRSRRISKLSDNILNSSNCLLDEVDISLVDTPEEDTRRPSAPRHTRLTYDFDRLHLEDQLINGVLREQNGSPLTATPSSPSMKTRSQKASLLFTPESDVLKEQDISSPTAMTSFSNTRTRSKKVSLLYTPQFNLRKSVRKSVKGDLITFSPCD